MACRVLLACVAGGCFFRGGGVVARGMRGNIHCEWEGSRNAENLKGGLAKTRMSDAGGRGKANEEKNCLP